MSLFVKDPNAVLDYQWDFSQWLATGDTILSHTVTIVDGDVVVDNSSNSTTAVTARVSGGSNLTSAHLTARVTTAQGRIDDRTITLLIRQR